MEGRGGGWRHHWGQSGPGEPWSRASAGKDQLRLSAGRRRHLLCPGLPGRHWFILRLLLPIGSWRIRDDLGPRASSVCRGGQACCSPAGNGVTGTADTQGLVLPGWAPSPGGVGDEGSPPKAGGPNILSRPGPRAPEQWLSEPSVWGLVGNQHGPFPRAPSLRARTPSELPFSAQDLGVRSTFWGGAGPDPLALASCCVLVPGPPQTPESPV